MTRGNLNFISQEWGQSPKTLFFYWNGDQYPTGIRDHYNILDWLKRGDFTKKGFKDWIFKNYEQNKPKTISHPAILYAPGGWITDYSYVFSANSMDPSVLVYNWGECVFNDVVENFIDWLEGQK